MHPSSPLAPAEPGEKVPSTPANADRITTVESGPDHLDYLSKSNPNAIEAEFADAQVRLHRGLSSRVITMMGLAGAIGTGLFHIRALVASGKAVVNGGAVGAVLGYTVVGILIGCMMMSLGEMSVLRPHSGSMVSFAGDYVDESFAFALGWTYWLFPAILPAVEIVAASILIQYWDMNEKHLAIYISVMIVLIMACNLIGSRWFGEIEAVFAYIKVGTIVGLIIAGLVISLGGGPNKSRTGFVYWQRYPFNDEFMGIESVNTARFLGFWAVLTQAAFSFGGIETIALAAGEAKNPRKSMKSAYKQIFLRIGVLYLCSMFIISMNVPRNDPNLLGGIAKGGYSVASSPFVVMIESAGIRILPHIINAVVVTSAFSAGNFSFFMSTRMLVALGREGHGPKCLTRTSDNGTPYYGFVIQSCLLALSFLAVSSGPNQAFTWLANITTLCNLICWASMCYAFTRFYRACTVQGVDRKQFYFRSWFQPYLAWVSMVSFLVILFFNGFTTFIGGFDYKSFIAAYLTLPVFGGLYVWHKLVRRPVVLRPDEVDLTPS